MTIQWTFEVEASHLTQKTIQIGPSCCRTYESNVNRTIPTWTPKTSPKMQSNKVPRLGVEP
jgi:hypothetical protein